MPRSERDYEASNAQLWETESDVGAVRASSPPPVPVVSAVPAPRENVLDYEASNAQLWETESDVGTVRASSPPPVPVVSALSASREGGSGEGGPRESSPRVPEPRSGQLVSASTVRNNGTPSATYMAPPMSQYPQYTNGVGRGATSTGPREQNKGARGLPITNGNRPLVTRGPYDSQGPPGAALGLSAANGNGPRGQGPLVTRGPYTSQNKQLVVYGSSHSAAAQPNVIPTRPGGQQQVYGGPSPAIHFNRGIQNGNPLSHRRARGYNLTRDAEQKVTSKDYFPKSEGPISKRDKAQKVAIKTKHNLNKRYVTGQPKEEEIQEQGFYQLDVELEDVLEFFGNNLEELTKIRQEHQVFIDYIAKDHCLRLRTHHGGVTNAAVNAIRLLIEELDAVTSASAAQYLIHPPAAERYRHDVVASSKSPGVAAPVLCNIRMTGPLLTGAEMMVYIQETFPGMVSLNNRKYWTFMKARLNEARPLKSWLQMRIHFGNVELTRYAASFANSSMTLERFWDMMGGRMIKGKFQAKMGGLTLADQTFEQIKHTDGKFCPPSSSYSNELKDVEPEHCFSVVVKDPRGKKIRVEIYLETAYRSSSYRIGTYECFENVEGKKRLDVTTVFLDEKFDMRHEIVINNLLVDLEPAMECLIEKIREAKLTMQTDAQGNLYPRISIVKDHFRPGQGHETLDGNIVIESIVLRSTRAFGLVRSGGYEVAISTYRAWTGHKTNIEPRETHVGVSAYHVGWDVLMEKVEGSNADRIWDSELRDFYPSTSGEDGFLRFLTYMDEIRKLLN